MNRTKKLSRKEVIKLRREAALHVTPITSRKPVDPLFQVNRILEAQFKNKEAKKQLREAKKNVGKQKMQPWEHQHGLGCRKDCRFRAGDPAASVVVEVVEHVHTDACHHEIDPVIQMAQEAEKELV